MFFCQIWNPEFLSWSGHANIKISCSANFAFWSDESGFSYGSSSKSFEKIMNVVLQFYELHVNYRHLALLCDVMTAKSHLMAITRHGISRQVRNFLFFF